MLFAPEPVGGSANYIVVNGISMEPMLHGGDLVIARRSSSFQIGDVVIYRDPTIGPVIHRITEEQDGHFTFKGDNNAWLDAYHAARSEIIGRLWLYVPRLGSLFMSLRQPRSMAMVTVCLAMVLLFFKGTRGKSKRRGTHSEGWSILMGKIGLSRDDLLLVVLVVGAISTGMGLFAFTQPLTRQQVNELSYLHQGMFSYSADDPYGVFDDGIVKPGEPVFRKFTNSITVTFAYVLTTGSVRNVSGSVRVLGEVSDSVGWKRTIELAPATPFAGNVYNQEIRVDLQTFQNLIDAMEKPTGIRRGGYALTIAPQVSVVGTAGELPWQNTFTPRLNFTMDDAMLALANYDPHQPVETQLKQTERGSVDQTITQPNTATLLVYPVNVLTARIAAVIGILLSTAIILLILWRSMHATPVEQIESAHSKLLVSAEHIQVPTGPVVDVATIEDLVKLAERDSRMVLHIRDTTRHLYVVQDGSTYYQYTLNVVAGYERDRSSAAQK